MAYLHQTPTGHHGFSGSLSDFVAHLRETFTRWRVYHRTVAELSQLSDRELGDLRLNRSAIRPVAREVAYG